MSRYPRLLAGLAVLALVYWSLGGFSADDPLPEGAPSELEQADSTNDTAEDAIGGPDDGLSLGMHPGGDHPAILDEVEEFVGDAAPHDDLDVQPLADLLGSTRVLLHDHDVVMLDGEALGQIEADLPGADDDHVHPDTLARSAKPPAHGRNSKPMRSH